MPATDAGPASRPAASGGGGGGEFDLIARFFDRRGDTAAGVTLGIGDDCALLRLEPGDELAISTDTLVGGVHFPLDGPADEIGQRALRVNLSDLAAMGATPRWFLLALTLPAVDQDWLAAFSRGLFAAAAMHRIALVGGDTTRGPLALTLTVMGAVRTGKALRRDGARPGDRIYVTGTLGDGAAALAALAEHDPSVDDDHLRRKYWQPCPRLTEGQLLVGIASAAIDVSDGLLADLGHIARRSGVGADIHLARLPMSRSMLRREPDLRLEWALSGGDDYELCFTVPASMVGAVEELNRSGRLSATAIGEIVAGDRIRCLAPSGCEVFPRRAGYDHFAD